MTFANAAWDRADVEFLNRNLMHVSSSHRILVVNKMDAVDDEAEVRAWLRTLRETGSAAARSIFDEGKSAVVYTCGVGGLIDAMLRNESELGDEELEQQRERLEPEGFLDPARHQVDALRAIIEKKLIANKGQALVESHRRFILNVFDRAISEQNVEAVLHDDEVELRSSNKETLEKERDDNKEAGERLAAMQVKFERSVNDALEISKKRVQDHVKSARRAVIAACKGKIQDVTDIDDFANMGWAVRDAIEDVETALWEGVRSAIKLSEDALKSVLREAVPALQESTGITPRMINCIIDICVADLIEKIQDGAIETFGSDTLESVIKECTGWWSRTWNTSGGRKEVRRKLSDLFESFAKEQFTKGLAQYVNRGIEEAAQGSLRKLAEDLTKARLARMKSLKKTLANMDEAKRDAETHRAAAEAARVRMKQLAEWRDAEEAQLGVG